ncbi:MAG: hypothetical protein KJ650_01405 [Firmicutes bacterium]|nr:hypothetical protein [Bacillota bacterium]MBV1727135.1 hypothetical protein [Desulforudis sp.]MBV1735683.1 hypothetical protein [Desulforudis sp.]
MTPAELITELELRNIKVSLAGDKLRLEAPAGVLTPALKEAIAKHKPELIAILSGRGYEEVFWPGVKSKVYRARQACLEAGHCCWVSETDCNLYLLTDDEGMPTGHCRERVGTN